MCPASARGGTDRVVVVVVVLLQTSIHYWPMIVLRPDEECRIGLAWWRFENVLASLVEQSRAGGRAGEIICSTREQTNDQVQSSALYLYLCGFRALEKAEPHLGCLEGSERRGFEVRAWIQSEQAKNLTRGLSLSLRLQALPALQR